MSSRDGGIASTAVQNCNEMTRRKLAQGMKKGRIDDGMERHMNSLFLLFALVARKSLELLLSLLLSLAGSHRKYLGGW